VEDAGREVEYLVCNRCGHVYQSPRMTRDELLAFYTRTYRELRQGTDEPVPKDLLIQAARARHTVRQISGWIPAVSRHLDVGSSSGAFLEAVRDRWGGQGVGVEPGEAYSRFSRARGWRVYPSRDKVVQAGEAPFDLVTAMHVLEHLPDPVKTLTELRRELMTPEALLLIEVPNLAEHEALELAHAHAFTLASARDAVQRAGFRILWARCHGGFRSPVLRLYATVLARRADEASKARTFPLAAGRTRLSRRIGSAQRRVFTRFLPDWTWQSPEKALEG